MYEVLAARQHQVGHVFWSSFRRNIPGCCAMQSWGGGDDIELVQSYRPHEARLGVLVLGLRQRVLYPFRAPLRGLHGPQRP